MYALRYVLISVLSLASCRSDGPTEHKEWDSSVTSPGGPSPSVLRLRFLPETLNEAQLSKQVAEVTSFFSLHACRPEVDLHVHVSSNGDVLIRLATATSVRSVDYRDEPGGEVLERFPRSENFVSLSDWAEVIPQCVRQFEAFHDPCSSQAIKVLITAEPGSPTSLLRRVRNLICAGQVAPLRLYSLAK